MICTKALYSTLELSYMLGCYNGPQSLHHGVWLCTNHCTALQCSQAQACSCSWVLLLSLCGEHLLLLAFPSQLSLQHVSNADRLPLHQQAPLLHSE
jgi:hypothetical protein